MSRQIVTISINGLSVAQFAADNFRLDIGNRSVTMECGVPDTLRSPVTIDPRAESLLGSTFTYRDGKPTTLADLSSKRNLT